MGTGCLVVGFRGAVAHTCCVLHVFLMIARARSCSHTWSKMHAGILAGAPTGTVCFVARFEGAVVQSCCALHVCSSCVRQQRRSESESAWPLSSSERHAPQCKQHVAVWSTGTAREPAKPTALPGDMQGRDERSSYERLANRFVGPWVESRTEAKRIAKATLAYRMEDIIRSQSIRRRINEENLRAVGWSHEARATVEGRAGVGGERRGVVKEDGPTEGPAC